ncbi:bifunctional phosphopantothenoylcysteine decarboxylase/phosphopantothenate--cysteine ligase CoaBC [Bacillus lacus]|uniref:Coenzyme A biosynthesis bifunctional protein CoaBC n=1 Tax=Metabacillus lacus TaxID=1983721 RepID=A0A7X2J2C5_9BACI|nr:bifunctional phosphopantothenoylcysteine decarboxylase/phosphopantothenate--cysteine ligase CoaBC [Metabacillus lacus]MRX73348.1 bifunctional phosphopantothenoylcysteine decarboxylase/phosphopantothenate--cysteine ligase CoaBC [Metabacillus lacus]
MGNGKKILLGVSGGIAVYKAAALTSKLVQAGYQVKVMMSDSAIKFVSPLTFQAISRNDVYIDTFDEKNSEVIAHIDLADWADLIIIAPATANVIGKLAHGIADNMITTTLLASQAPVWLAPAMNVNMYNHPAVQKNISTLAGTGYQFIEPSEGYLACGYIGKGRLEEPEKITALVHDYFSAEVHSLPLKGKHVLITAGPTREELDPVRFFSNASTGKMGYSIASQAVAMGARVTLISGPVSLEAPTGAELIQVESAEQMFERVLQRYDEADIVIKTAAVADYRPKFSSSQKMKKSEGTLVIEMERTPDILKELGRRKRNQILVGFAAETNSVEEYAKRKLQEKNLDFIVANNVSEEGAGFGTDTNIVTIYRRDGEHIELPLLQKKEVADRLLAAVAAVSGSETK